MQAQNSVNNNNNNHDVNKVRLQQQQHQKQQQHQQQHQQHQQQQTLPHNTSLHIPTLPNQYLHYQSPFRTLYQTRSLFKVLFLKYRTCLMCIMKIYCIEYPKMYSDGEFLALMLKKLLIVDQQQQQKKQQNNSLSSLQLFSLTEQQLFNNYNPIQKIYCHNQSQKHNNNINNTSSSSSCCWLCQQLMQKQYINLMKSTIMQMIDKNNYVNYQKYKLNIKMPLIYVLKYYVLCMYLWNQFDKQSRINTNDINVDNSNNNKDDTQMYRVSQQQLRHIQNILKTPYDKLSPKCPNNPILQTKVVSKWLISTQINTQTPLQSTIQQLEDMLTINIQHQYHNFYIEDNLMKLFHQRVGLEKKLKTRNQKLIEKPQKKIKIDLTGLNNNVNVINEDVEQNNINIEQHNNNQLMQTNNNNQSLDNYNKRHRNQSYKCIANNVNKIIYLKYQQIKFILDKFKTDQQFLQLFKKLDNPQIIEQRQRIMFVNSFKSVSRSIKLETKNICFSGKYCKYSRYLSQTPWVVNGIKLTQSSLQQQMQDKILHLFYPNIPKERIETKFHSGGRQDIDVRMLKGGRPFVLELVNPIYRLKDISVQKIINDCNNLPVQIKANIIKNIANIPDNKQKIMHAMQQIINNTTQLVQIKDFQQADQSYISVQLKKAEIQKIKHYVCYIVSDQELTQKDKQIIEKQYDLQLDQKTPLRVLHRRTLMIRKKMVHKMYMHLVTKYSAVIQIWASAGTYIKEFVHGDVERTLPNFGSLIGKKVDILQLDVGSLKEGNWEKGDDINMKLDDFDWKQ